MSSKEHPYAIGAVFTLVDVSGILAILSHPLPDIQSILAIVAITEASLLGTLIWAVDELRRQ